MSAQAEADRQMRSSWPSTTRDGRTPDEVCKQAYREHELFMVHPSDPRLTPEERSVITRAAERIYGLLA